MQEENYFGADDEMMQEAIKGTRDEFDDDLMGDEEDRKYLSSLPELEREKILNQRHAKRERNRQRKEALERLNQEKEMMKNQLTGNPELDKLKREREKRRERRENDFIDDDESYDLDESDDEDYGASLKKRSKRRTGDSDSEYENPDDLGPRKKLKTSNLDSRDLDRFIDATSKDLKVIEKICLKRNFLIKMSPHLYFKKTVQNCLVKTTYKIASDKIDYRIGKIVDVIEKEESYKVETQSGAKKLNKYLIVRIGNEEKEFQFVYISNKEIKDRELYNWLQELASYNLKKPTLAEIQNKQKDIESILHSKYKAKEIKQMVDKRREDRYKVLTDPHEKKRFLEKKIQDVERKYFEKPTQGGKDQLKSLKSQLREVLRSLRRRRSRKGSVDKYYNVKKNKSELYGFSQGKKIGGEKDSKSNIHARTIANPVNMWSIKEKELEVALEDQKKRFDVHKGDENKEDFDPSKALYNRNLAIKDEFMCRFQRDLRIDDLINNLQVDITI